MMAWFIYVPEEVYTRFYVFCEKNCMTHNILCLKRMFVKGTHVVLFMGNFDVNFAERIEQTFTGIKCLILGPSSLWKKALQ